MAKKNKVSSHPKSPQTAETAKERKRERKRRRKRKRMIKRAAWVLAALFGGSCILEVAVYHLGSIFLVLSAVFAAILELVLVVLSYLLEPDEKDEKPKKSDGLAERIVMGARNLRRRIWNNSTYFLIFAFTFWVLGSSALAATHTAGRVVARVAGIFETLMDSSEQQLEIADSTGPLPDSLPDIPEEPAAELPSPPLETVSALAPSKYVALTEPDRILTLSGEEREALYYLSGTYAIENWEDDEAVYAMVSAHVDALVAQEREDVFPKDADDPLQTVIKEASDDEAVMKTSEDLDSVIARREMVYQDDPFAQLAKLIAENYNGYGLAYDSIDGSEATVEYYWGTSITWYQENLTFSNSPQNISKILERIGMRYHDLAAEQPLDSQPQKYAEKLSAAYDALAQYYADMG